MNNYIKELRQKVGSRPLMMCGVAAAIIDDSNRLLLQHRTDNNCWGLPGGCIELGENVEDAIKREVKEEIGIQIEGIKIFNAYSGKELYYKYPNGDEVYNITIVYIINSFKGNIVVDNYESKDAQFFSLVEIPNNINPPDKTIIRDLIKLMCETK